MVFDISRLLLLQYLVYETEYEMDGECSMHRDEK